MKCSTKWKNLQSKELPRQLRDGRDYVVAQLKGYGTLVVVGKEVEESQLQLVGNLHCALQPNSHVVGMKPLGSRTISLRN